MMRRWTRCDRRPALGIVATHETLRSTGCGRCGRVGVATARLFVWPSAGSPTSADAVVIFAGGRGERLARAQQLMADGLASNLVVPNGTAPEWPAGNTACREDRPYAVFCPVPDPDTTQGEARAIAGLAQARGWTHAMTLARGC